MCGVCPLCVCASRTVQAAAQCTAVHALVAVHLLLLLLYEVLHGLEVKSHLHQLVELIPAGGTSAHRHTQACMQCVHGAGTDIAWQCSFLQQGLQLLLLLLSSRVIAVRYYRWWTIHFTAPHLLTSSARAMQGAKLMVQTSGVATSVCLQAKQAGTGTSERMQQELFYKFTVVLALSASTLCANEQQLKYLGSWLSTKTSPVMPTRARRSSCIKLCRSNFTPSPGRCSITTASSLMIVVLF